MTRRRSGTNWSWLRWLIESNLRQHPGFQGDFRLEEKIQSLGNGLFHKNYLFEASGKHLVLRLGIVDPGLRTRREAVMSLRREAKTLHALCSFNLPFVASELICLVNDESGETVGLIESAVDGMPLSFLAKGREPEESQKIITRITRGVRKPLGVPGGLHRLVQFYNEAAENKISANAVVVHEVMLHLNWLAEAAEARAKKDFGGHGPEHYASFLGGILRRAPAGQ
jgi:hypothetical protein